MPCSRPVNSGKVGSQLKWRSPKWHRLSLRNGCERNNGKVSEGDFRCATVMRVAIHCAANATKRLTAHRTQARRTMLHKTRLEERMLAAMHSHTANGLVSSDSHTDLKAHLTEPNQCGNCVHMMHCARTNRECALRHTALQFAGHQNVLSGHTCNESAVLLQNRLINANVRTCYLSHWTSEK